MASQNFCTGNSTGKHHGSCGSRGNNGRSSLPFSALHSVPCYPSSLPVAVLQRTWKKKVERENREKKTRQRLREPVGSKTACALPCLGSSCWRSQEVAFPALQTNGVCRVNGEKKASGHHMHRGPCSWPINSEVWPGRTAAGASTLPLLGGLCQKSLRKMGSPSRGGNGWSSWE